MSDLPLTVVYPVLTGSGLLVVVGTGLLAWKLDQRARRREAGQLPPLRLTRRERREWRRQRGAEAALGTRAAGTVLAAEAVTVVGGIHPVPDAVAATGMPIDLDAPRPGRPIWAGPTGEYAQLRAAAARAASVASRARATSADAAATLDRAEREYSAARRAHEAGGNSAGQAGGNSAGQAGLDASRQRYHIALARARAADQAVYVADTAVRALGAETAAMAGELAAGREQPRKARRRWLRPAVS